jgi:hypothetical protein
MTRVQQKLFREALKDGMNIQHRFNPEPTLAVRGVGSMKSEGISTVRKIKDGIARTQARRLAAHR